MAQKERGGLRANGSSPQVAGSATARVGSRKQQLGCGSTRCRAEPTVVGGGAQPEFTGIGAPCHDLVWGEAEGREGATASSMERLAWRCGLVEVVHDGEGWSGSSEVAESGRPELSLTRGKAEKDEGTTAHAMKGSTRALGGGEVVLKPQWRAAASYFDEQSRAREGEREGKQHRGHPHHGAELRWQIVIGERCR